MITFEELEKIIKDNNIELCPSDYCEQRELISDYWDSGKTLLEVMESMAEDWCFEDFYVNSDHKDSNCPELNDVELWMESGHSDCDYFVCELRYNNQIIAGYYSCD